MSEDIGDGAEWYRVGEHLTQKSQTTNYPSNIFPVLSVSPGNCLSNHDHKKKRLI